MSIRSRGGGRRVSILDLQEIQAHRERIAMLTAYGFLFVRPVVRAGTAVILVGDSLAQVVRDQDSTLPSLSTT